jgi:ABC-type multidrug transport system fused ATPase/permease subunit
MVSGQAISKVNTLDLRKRFAYISQSIQLLEENIGEKINQMKKIYQELNLLNVMNRDFDVNQKKLSGGEAQKIELALALSKASEVDVLILDEATSNLDYIAEKEILDAILERFSDKIVICIAHRLTSITNFQKIVVIDDGNIKETGSHHELLNLHGIYFSLWNKQLSSQN